MKTVKIQLYKLMGVATVVMLSACSTPAMKPEGVDAVRDKLALLQADAQLAGLVSVEIKEAESAVRAAEKPMEDTKLSNHLVYVADRKVDIATARAKTRLLVDQRQALKNQSNDVLLQARTLDVKNARSETDAARAETVVALEAVEKSRSEMKSELARSSELQQQIGALNAKATDRGVIMTLGDLSFATGKSELKSGVGRDLDKLAAFLDKYDDRTIIIEGHTDNVGSEALNFSLSQQRAGTVRDYLVSKGIDSGRMTVLGKGEGSPLDSNESAIGRQHNRRVEIIISHSMASGS